MANQIIGARVKAAALVHAGKQLSNLGFRFKTGAGSATFGGDTAYAAWNAGESDWVNSFRINYPDMPDNALVSRREADLISAYTLHEIGHVAFTASAATRGERALVHYLYNGIEDGRIEHAVIASGKARGARSMFKKLMSKFTSKIVAEGEFNPCSINSAPFALALVSRAAMGDGNGFAKQLLGRIPEPYRELYAAVADGIRSAPLDRSGSAVSLSLAKQFLDGWLRINPSALDSPAAPPPNTGPQEDGISMPADGGDQDGDPAEDSIPDQLEEEQLSDSGPSGHWSPPDRDLGDLFDDNDEGFDDEQLSPAEQAAAEADAKERDELAEQMAEATEGAPQADDSILDALPESDSDEEGGDGVVDDPFKALDKPDQFDDSKVIKPEPEVDDVFKSIRERTREPISLRAVPGANRSEMRRWSKLQETTDRTKRSHLKKLNRHALPALKAQLYRVLRAPERCGWDNGAMGGRFDGKRAPRMLAGSEQVFKRRWLAEGIDTAVSVVVDLSGSMQGSSIEAAVDLAWTIAAACEGARADVEVVGFQNARYPVYGGGYDMRGEWVSSTGNSDCTLVVAKRFADRCESVAHHFATMKRLPDMGTPDYEACKTVVEQLSDMPHKRKVVIMVTDGFGDWQDMYRLGEAAHKLYGVDVIGFGIYCGAAQFARAYPVGSPVSLDSLHKTGLKGVIKQLESRDQRRVI
jgi:hypothetical protein